MTQHDADVEVIRRYCPYYAAATQMLGRRWAAGVLRALVTGPARFSDIAAAIPGMTDKLLSQRLKDLEATPPAQHAFVFTTPHRAANVARSSRL